MTRKFAAALTVAVTVGVSVVVPGTASADGCYVAQSRRLFEIDDQMVLRLWECPSPRSSEERLAWGDLRGGDGDENLFGLYYRPWLEKGLVPGSLVTPDGRTSVSSTPTYYSRPNELQVCMKGPFCTWPE